MSEERQTDAIQPKAPEQMKPRVDMGRPGHGSLALIPKDFDQMYRLAQIMAASGMMPKGCDRPEQVFVAVQMGLEVGLSPMQSVQNVAVINGRPTLYGDAVVGLVLASGLCEELTREQVGTEGKDDFGWTVYSRRAGGNSIRHTFAVADAKKAGLWESKDTWKKYPKRMLMWRAFSWVARDLYADVLKGLHITEEAYDMPPVVVAEVREPIAMPKALPASEPEPAAPEPETPQNAPEEPDANGGPSEPEAAAEDDWESTEATITRITKQATSDGYRFITRLSGNAYYSDDEAVQAEMEAAKIDELPAKVFWTDGEDGMREVVRIETP